MPSSSRSLAPRPLLALLCACALWGALPSHASAQQPPQSSAEEEYAHAIQLYNEGRNREALAAFDRAIARSPDPVYRCNRAVVLVVLEEYDRAIEDLTRCRDEYQMPDEKKAYIDAQLKALTVFERVLKPHAREAAALIASPPRLVTTPPDRGPITPVTPPPPASRPLRPVGWVALGLGTGALLGAGGLEFYSRHDVQRYKESCLQAASPAPDCAALQTSLRPQQNLSRLLLGSGALLALGGVTLLIVTRQEPAPTQVTPTIQAARLTPAIAPGQGALTLTLDF